MQRQDPQPSSPLLREGFDDFSRMNDEVGIPEIVDGVNSAIRLVLVLERQR